MVAGLPEMAARMTRIGALPSTLSEDQFKTTVIDYAIRRRWLVHHSLPSKLGDRYVTALQGHPGLPDLILARGGVLLAAELKKQNGTVRPAQKLWGAAIGAQHRLWRPSDWPAIYEELR